MAISKLFSLEETYQRMGSRIEKFLIIQVHSNSNLNIKTRYDYYVAPVPSDLFKLYSYCAQYQGCGELKTVMTQGTKVDPGVTNPWGVSPLSPLYLNHSISPILPLISCTSRIRQLQTHPSSKTMNQGTE